MKNLIYTLTLGPLWIAGIVLASGWFSTLCAILFPIWAWYLVVEKVLQQIGWI